jgi:hypothetical protein
MILVRRIIIRESFKRHRPLKTPLDVTIPEPKSEFEEQVIQYVLETFIQRQPLLAKFTFENQSTFDVAKHLLLYRIGSQQTLNTYISNLQYFSKFVDIGLDQLIERCKHKDFSLRQQALNQTSRFMDQFIFEQQKTNAPYTIAARVGYLKAFFRLNGINLGSRYNLRGTPLYEDRSPTPVELQKVLINAKLRERVMITMMATGGFRKDTLLALEYRHLKNDFEKNIIPLHVHVEPSITKGKYCSYDTFLNEEAVEYLKAYIDARKRGTRRTPPEQITDSSPIIRNCQSKQVATITPNGVNRLLRDLFVKAGISMLLPACNESNAKIKKYDIQIQSLRKFFRTELASRGVNSDYIEYMMGHKKDTYHDVKMKGVEFLRGIYFTAGLTIRPRIKLSKIETLKEIINAWGLNPEDILNRKVLEPNFNGK